ncbi:MAG: hypothetical protein LEGION0398_MBIBDBAK_00180 [Legionellaceae bacterium]
MKKVIPFYYQFLTNVTFTKSLYFLSLLAFFFFSSSVFAGNQGDILAGTEKALGATIDGTGRKYLIAAEGILSLAAYIKTKNLLVLGGVAIVCIFINILLKVSGIGG